MASLPSAASRTSVAREASLAPRASLASRAAVTSQRFHSLDAVRAFALLLGVFFHASMSFVPGMLPGVWVTVDRTSSVALGQLFFASHIFRMSLFFVMAGFFARLLYRRSGPRGFWANRLKRIGVPLIVGWCVLFPTFMLIESWGLKQYFGGHMPAMPGGLHFPPGFFPFLHLWFLYALLLLYPTVLVLRRAVLFADRAGILQAGVDRVGQVLLGSPLAVVLAPVLLGAPLALTLFLKRDWVYWGGIPGQDVTYIPQAAVMIGYGTAMLVGWLLHRRTVLLESFEKRWLAHLALAVLATVYCSAVAGTKLVIVPAPMNAARALFAAAYVVALWSWIFALVGVALRFLAGESRILRYVADSSYWIYLVHLPVVAALDVVVRPWHLHWAFKYGFVMAVAFALLFASYHLLVRPTFIGEFLNGRKHPWRRAGRQVMISDNAAAPSPEAAVASLECVTRRYGKTVALDGVDLTLRRGELLALLGPNGAGKTSAIGLLLGLAEPSAGRATLLGGSPLDIGRRRGVGVMMQDVTLTPGMRVRELVAQAASYYPEPLGVDEALAITGTTALGGCIYEKLSGGQKRQAQFAVAICGRPSVLFLDEPSAGLDVQAREHLWTIIRTLRRSGCSIVLTTHYLEEAEALADRVVVLARGHVVASGTVDGVRAIVSRRRIRCESVLSAEEVAGWPGVMSASREHDRLTIMTVQAEDVLRRLLASDPKVASVEVQQAGLAEAFVELTREAA
jgi:ABC-type multidrug transport system ATPase subunit/peptidoglycan/LPS O-acetylase OafA/YrhL